MLSQPHLQEQMSSQCLSIALMHMQGMQAGPPTIHVHPVCLLWVAQISRELEDTAAASASPQPVHNRAQAGIITEPLHLHDCMQQQLMPQPSMRNTCRHMRLSIYQGQT